MNFLQDNNKKGIKPLHISVRKMDIYDTRSMIIRRKLSSFIECMELTLKIDPDLTETTRSLKNLFDE